MRLLRRPFRFLTGVALAFVAAFGLLMAAGYSSVGDPSLREFLDCLAAPGLIWAALMAWGLGLAWTSRERVLPRRGRARPR